MHKVSATYHVSCFTDVLMQCNARLFPRPHKRRERQSGNEVNRVAIDLMQYLT